MKKQLNKRGISLIVLVITIIVMIILATAIILSIQSSGIIGKANKAKADSDLTTKKEAISLKLAEYELAKQSGDSSVAGKTAGEYVMEELKKDNIDTSDIAVTDEGEIVVGIAALFINNNVPVGTPVTGYKLSDETSAKTVTTTGDEIDDDLDSTYTGGPETYTREETITWKYMGINENGKAMIVGDVTEDSPNVVLIGWGGANSGPSTINDICKKMYSSDMGVARSVDIDDWTTVKSTSLATDKIYWLASLYTYYYEDEDYSDYAVYVSGESETSLGSNDTDWSEPMVDMDSVINDTAYQHYIRPIVTLFDSIQMTYNGTTVTLK